MGVVVVGLGNPILSDDGVGIAVARRLRETLPADAGIAVVEAYAGGLRLMEAMAGYDRAVIVDAMKSGLLPPGSVQVFEPATARTRHTLCTHDSDLATALALGRDLGLALPRCVEVVAVEAQDVETFGEELSAAVRAAVPTAAAEALRRLGWERLSFGPGFSRSQP